MYDVCYYIVHNYITELPTLIQLNQTSKEFHILTKQQIKLYKLLHDQSLTFFDDFNYTDQNLRYLNVGVIRSDILDVFHKVAEFILKNYDNLSIIQSHDFWMIASHLNDITNNLFPFQEGDIFEFNRKNCAQYCRVFQRIKENWKNSN
jgi:hypothetical protein